MQKWELRNGYAKRRSSNRARRVDAVRRCDVRYSTSRPVSPVRVETRPNPRPRVVGCRLSRGWLLRRALDPPGIWIALHSNRAAQRLDASRLRDDLERGTGVSRSRRAVDCHVRGNRRLAAGIRISELRAIERTAYRGELARHLQLRVPDRLRPVARASEDPHAPPGRDLRSDPARAGVSA